jgi:outer membrane protein TolC
LSAVLLLLLLPFGLGAQGAASTAAPSTAPTALKLSLDDTVDLALRNNLGLKTERLKLDEKKGDLDSNWNVFLPKVNLTAVMSRSNLSDDDRAQPDLTKFPDYAASLFTGPFPTMTIPRWGAQLLLELNWNLSVAQFLSVKQTSLDYTRGLLATKIAEKRLTREVKKIYYSLLLSRESVQVFQQTFDQAQRRLDLARAREKIGSASELDVLAEEVNLESVRPQIIEQSDSYEIALANLKRLLGVKQDVAVSLDGGLDLPSDGNGDSPTLLQKMRTRLDLSYLRGVIDALRNKLELDRSGLTPSLFVRWTVDPTFQRDPLDPSTWSGVSFTDLWKQSQGALAIGVSIPLDPLLPSSRQRTDIARSNLQVAEAELGYQSALEGAEIEVLTLIKELDKSAKLIAAAEKSITLAERLYAAAEKAYENGAKNYLELQDAQNKLNVARFERLRDRYGYLSTLTELEFALTTGDLAPS